MNTHELFDKIKEVVGDHQLNSKSWEDMVFAYVHWDMERKRLEIQTTQQFLTVQVATHIGLRVYLDLVGEEDTSDYWGYHVKRFLRLRACPFIIGTLNMEEFTGVMQPLKTLGESLDALTATELATLELAYISNPEDQNAFLRDVLVYPESWGRFTTPHLLEHCSRNNISVRFPENRTEIILDIMRAALELPSAKVKPTAPPQEFAKCLNFYFRVTNKDLGLVMRRIFEMIRKGDIDPVEKALDLYSVEDFNECPEILTGMLSATRNRAKLERARKDLADRVRESFIQKYGSATWLDGLMLP